MKHWIVVLLCVAFFSCTNDKTEVEVIKLDKAINNTISINLSKITDSIRYIQLEKNDSCLISKIEKIEISDTLIFVKNHKDGLFVFSLAGDYITTIGGMGKGPGEYISFTDFIVDEANRTVIIFDQHQSKIMKFGFDGEFYSEQQLKNFPDNIKLIGSSFYCSTSFLGVDTMFYEYKDNKLASTFSKKDFFLNEYKEHITHIDRVSVFEDSLTYWNDLTNYAFRIKDGKCYNRYYFDFGKYTNKDMNRSSVTSIDYKSRGEFGGVDNFIETKNYIFINSVYKNYARHVLYDKTSKIASSVDNKLCEKNKLFHNLSFVNNIDGIVNFWPDHNGKINDSVLYRTFYAYDFKYLKNCKFQNDSIITINSNLQRIIEESSYTDNPIIMIINLK